MLIILLLMIICNLLNYHKYIERLSISNRMKKMRGEKYTEQSQNNSTFLTHWVCSIFKLVSRFSIHKNRLHFKQSKKCNSNWQFLFLFKRVKIFWNP